ncbi:MAG: hypothetical protein ACKO37_04915 [Vampirovibrionales bacterium]
MMTLSFVQSRRVMHPVYGTQMIHILRLSGVTGDFTLQNYNRLGQSIPVTNTQFVELIDLTGTPQNDVLLQFSSNTGVNKTPADADLTLLSGQAISMKALVTHWKNFLACSRKGEPLTLTIANNPTNSPLSLTIRIAEDL